MKPNTITIFITIENGELAYKDREGNDKWWVRASKGDTVSWNSKAGPFAIHFGQRTPFRVFEFRATDEVSGTILEDARRGTYKYSVAVSRPNEPPILDDPEMLID